MSVSDSTLTFGIELEYPTADGWETTFRKPATGSFDIEANTLRHSWAPAGELTYDATVGAEAVSPELDDRHDDPEAWFAFALEEFEDKAPYEPCGYAGRHDQASSFGLHIHMSEMHEDDAKLLAEMSEEPWMQLFVCSSIAKDGTDETFKVFRDNYCNLNYDRRRYSVVNGRGHGHYEWRLPEPMTEENFCLMMDFLRKFNRAPPGEAGEARSWAKGLVEDADPRLTSVKRIREIGIEALLDVTEDDAHDATYPAGTEVNRSLQSLNPMHGWFFDIKHCHERPYIYKVDMPDYPTFLGFYTGTYAVNETFEDDGIEYSPTDVIDTRMQDVVRDSDIQEMVNDAIEDHHEASQQRSEKKSRATEKLASIVQE